MRKFKIVNSTKEADKDKSDHGDDWETDPNFERDMTEIDQRWGSKRTVGSINMSQLIKDVHKDHEILSDRDCHASQKDHSAGFGGKFGIQKDRKDNSAFSFDHHEKLSKHTSQEINNKSFSSSSKSIIENYEESFEKKSGNSISEEKSTKLNKEIFEKTRSKPIPESKSSQTIMDRINKMSSKFDPKFSQDNSTDIPRANMDEKSSHIKVERKVDDGPTMPKSIRSMSEKFENMCKESRDNFRKLTEERRKEFFNEIKSQVKETRKGFDGFDTPEDTTVDSPASEASNKCHNLREFREEVQTKIVKENDKIVQNETKRNVTSSSHHGLSDNQEREDRWRDNSGSTKSPAGNNSNVGLKAKALYSHDATDGDEISFDVGDLITDIEKVDPGWYKGTINKEGKVTTGWFPANYITFLNDPESH